MKLILSPFVFKSSVELAVGLWILYNTNMFENFYGSDAYTVRFQLRFTAFPSEMTYKSMFLRTFQVFLVFATVTSKFLQVFFLWLFRGIVCNFRLSESRLSYLYCSIYSS